jgi:undecaprenyl-phosphate galactose phosphotransferase/putative colanic acid biosynthesis UDP-glucose lipid carrier transferase
MNIRSATLAGSQPVGVVWRPDVPLEQAASFLALAIDATIVVLASVATGILFHQIYRGVQGDLNLFAGTGAIVALVFCGLVRLQAGRDVRASATRLGRARMAALAWAATFLFLIVLAFSMKLSDHFSRGSVFSFFVVGLFCIVASRAVVPRVLSRVFAGTAHRGSEVLLVTPRGELEAALANELYQQGCRKVHTIEFDDGGASAAWIMERQRLLQSVFAVARAAGPGEVYVMRGRLPLDAAMGLVSGLRLLPRAVLLVPEPELASLLMEHPIKGAGGIVALEMQRAPMSRMQRIGKRAMDIAIAAFALVFSFPLLLTIAAAIKLDSPGPVFFRQKRLGYRGWPFSILKFRTMTVLEDGAVIQQASRGDARVTRMGRWLRRSSLDELPQIWNVLQGDMSIVGPRPHAASHDAQYAKLIENYEVRQHVKPGLTGWAQVQGLRGETPHLDLMYRRIEADLWYASNCSLALDVQILFKTIGVVFHQKNAF